MSTSFLPYFLLKCESWCRLNVLATDHFSHHSKSETSRTNNSGEITLPCGTPEVSFLCTASKHWSKYTTHSSNSEPIGILHLIFGCRIMTKFFFSICFFLSKMKISSNKLFIVNKKQKYVIKKDVFCGIYFSECQNKVSHHFLYICINSFKANKKR